MFELFANSGDPDQILHSAASDLALHCMPITLLGVSRLQWVKDSGQSFLRQSAISNMRKKKKKKKN